MSASLLHPSRGSFVLQQQLLQFFQPLQNQLHHTALRGPSSYWAVPTSQRHFHSMGPLLPRSVLMIPTSSLFSPARGVVIAFRNYYFRDILEVPFLLSQVPTIYQMQKEEFSCKKNEEPNSLKVISPRMNSANWNSTLSTKILNPSAEKAFPWPLMIPSFQA